jgi:hypothetical protein
MDYNFKRTLSPLRNIERFEIQDLGVYPLDIIAFSPSLDLG